MENWYKVTLPYGKGSAQPNQLQLAFEIAWEAHGSPLDAALFVNHDAAHEYELSTFRLLPPPLRPRFLVSLRVWLVCLRRGLGQCYWLGIPSAAESLLPEELDSD